MTYSIPKVFALVLLCALLAGCGGMADPGPLTTPAGEPVPAETAEQGLEFDKGLDFERASPVLRNVRRCDGCEKLHILRIESEQSSEDDEQEKKDERGWLDEVADGNPVPFPLDEKKPYLD